jgi:PAS domain S-box-containing protein
MPSKLISRHSWLVRYGGALAAVGAGLLLRLALTAWVGPGLPTYITFYPAVMAVALLGGLGPGLLATAAAALAVDYWIMPPPGFGIEKLVDAVGLVFFSGMGLFMSLVAEYYRRARLKAAAFDREQALRETQQQKEFLANVLERASQPFAVGYPDGRLGLFNRAFVELTGYTAEELRSMDWSQTLTPPEWRELQRQKLEELHRTGQPVRYEKEYLRKDGRRVPIELLVHLAPDAQAKPEYYYSFVTDISGRKRAEEAERRLNAELQQRVAELQVANEALGASRKAALNLMEDALQARKQAEAASTELRKAAEQRRLALEAADLGAWDYHFHTGEVFWDERCREMWGMGQSDRVSYASAISQIHPEDRAGVDTAVQQALAGRDGGACHQEFRVVWPDGSVHWIASHGHVCFSGEGGEHHPIRFIGTNREITAEKEAEEALRESQERLAAFAAATFEGIVLSDRGRILDCNEQFARLAGCTVPELKGCNIEQLIAPEDRQRVVENILAGRESLIEHQMLRRDGSRLTVEAHGRRSDPSRPGPAPYRHPRHH